jgi:hypothetical protein
VSPALLRTWAGACALVVGFSAASCSDTFVTRYDTVSAARADRLFERGWLPDVFPAESGPIVESYDVDTNARCARVTFSAASRVRIQAALSAAGFEATRPPTRKPELRQCPFSGVDADAAPTLLMRRRREFGDLEFAAVFPGELLYWSAQSQPAGS